MVCEQLAIRRGGYVCTYSGAADVISALPVC